MLAARSSPLLTLASVQALQYYVRASQSNSGRLNKVVHDTARRQALEFQRNLEALRVTLKEQLKPLRDQLDEQSSKLNEQSARLTTFSAVVGSVGSAFTLNVWSNNSK
ncbi:hypothetical protein WJX73_000351 [Symbiochloris irregularis]|uniref:Uncharacterized protein n=1 Tax=Symbiochloris irregularis TaxID=706552 RepID=A0AAW1PMM3_9CHLO